MTLPNEFIPPWPEWNDSEIISEIWDPNGLDSKRKSKLKTNTMNTSKSVMENAESAFEDPSGHCALPAEFEVVDWKRPQEINPNFVYTVVSSDTVSDIFSRNSHLLTSKLMEFLLVSILWLDRKSQDSPFVIEFQGPKFKFPANIPWKPWQHVYSKCKTYTDLISKPEYNSYGKYIVRVFYVGRWRRILVDDYFPIDKNGKVLLPVLKDPSQLWLPILSKALLKVALITGETSFICILTGWMQLILPCRYTSEAIIWSAISKRLKEQAKRDIKSEPLLCATNEMDECINTDAVFSTPTVAPALITVLFRNELNEDTQITKMGMVVEVHEDENNISILEELRIKTWKKLRWVEWAVSHGIIKDVYKGLGRKIMLCGPSFCMPSIYSCDPPNVPELQKFMGAEHYDWYFMYEVYEILRTICIYYQPSKFANKKNILDVGEILFPLEEKTYVKEEKPKATKDSKRDTDKEKVPEIIITEEPNTSSQHSGCFYFISDSKHCKTIFLTISGYYSSFRHSIFISGESYSWKLPNIGKFLFSIQNHPRKTIQISLDAGLQAIRFWYSLPSNYCIFLSSMVPFQVTNKEKAQEILSFQTVIETLYAENTSQAFIDLMADAQSLATHGEALKNFMDSLQPLYIDKQVQSWNEKYDIRIQIIKEFENVLMEMLISNLLKINLNAIKNALQKFRHLFLDPKFGSRVLRNIFQTKMFPSSSSTDDELNLFNEENFRFLESDSQVEEIVTPEMKTSSKGEKQSKKEKNKVSTQRDDYLFLNSKENVLTLLRKIAENLPHIQKYYSFDYNMRSQLSYVDYHGSTPVKMSGDIVFLIRYVFNVTNENPLPFAFHIYSSIKKLVIRVIDNESGGELMPGLNENNTYFLCRNKLGYCVLVYAKADDSFGNQLKQPEINWKLRTIGMVNHQLPYAFSPFIDDIIQSPQAISLLNFEGLYLTEKDDVFCRCVLNITKNAFVTLHLVASSDSVCIALKLKGNKQKCLASGEGIHEVILPITALDMDNGIPSVDGNGVLFAVEGYVLNDSWKLSEDSKTALRCLREITDDLGSKQLKRTSRKSSITKNLPGAELLPVWLLTAVFDLDVVSSCKLLPDTQFEDEIKRQKETWISGDEDRRLRGIEAREEFLKQISDDYFTNIPLKLKPHNISKESEVSLKSDVSMAETPPGTRTKSLLYAKELFSDSKLVEEVIEKSDMYPLGTEQVMISNYNLLIQKIRLGKKVEQFLQNKAVALDKNIETVLNFKKQIFQQISESMSPRKVTSQTKELRSKGKRST